MGQVGTGRLRGVGGEVKEFGGGWSKFGGVGEDGVGLGVGEDWVWGLGRVGGLMEVWCAGWGMVVRSRDGWVWFWREVSDLEKK